MSKTSILPLFPLLSSHDLPTRLDASLSLLSSLPLSTSSASASTSEDADTPYAIKRLVTGLASSNEASRQGFAVALTELIARLPDERAQTVLPLVLSTSTPNAGSDSREERDLLFARLLGLHAVIRSGILFRVGCTNGETFKEVILALLALSGKKSWIREPAYWVLIQGITTLLALEGGDDSVPAWREEMGGWMIQRLLNDSREKARGFSSEKVALVLVLQAHAVEADYISVLSPTFPTGNPLARASLVSLSQALKGNTDVEVADTASGKGTPKMGSNAVKTSKGGSATPGSAPHFVWNAIFDLYFPEEGRKIQPGESAIEVGRAKWPEVWRILVDQSLFAVPSLPLKSTGFSLLSLAIQRLPPTEIPALFGEGIIRTLANHLRKSGDGEKTLSRAAEKVAAAFLPFLTANPTVSLPLLKALIAPPHGSHAFDHRTVERIVAKLDLKGVKGWIKYLTEFILGEEKTIEAGIITDESEIEDEKAMVARRLWAFDQLLHVAKSGALEKDDEVNAGLLEFFAVLGWFEVRKSGKGARSYVPFPAFTPSLQLASRSRFFSILTSLPTTPSASGTWLSRALALLDNLSADSKHFTLIPSVTGDEPDEEVEESRKEVKEMYEKLVGSEDERKSTGRSLVEGVLLLAYDEGEEASEALEQVKDCLPALFPDIFEAAKGAESDEDEDEDMEDPEDIPEAATVLLDMLLELLHRPSAFVKSVAQTVFTGFADEIGEQAMELLLEQIRPEEADAVDEEEDADASMLEEPKASTSKAPKASTSKKIVEAEVDSDDDDARSSDDEDDDMEVDENFRNELLAALQANGVADEFDAKDSDDGEESEEELLDDDQMMAMDEKLADIFRLQGGGRKGKKIERTDDIHYRLRVVDLIESLFKHKSSNSLLVLVVLPLFNIVRSSSEVEQELSSKANKLLRQIITAKKDSPAPADPALALDVLTELHSISQSVDSADLATLCSQTCAYLVKSALASPSATPSTSTAISTIYADSFESYLSKKNSKTKVQPALTIDFVRRFPACAWGLFERIVKLAAGESASTSTVNAYRRMQAFEVAQALLTSYSAIKSAESKSAILSVMPSYRLAIHSTLSSSLTETTSIFDAARLKELLKLSLASVRLTLNASDLNKALTEVIWKSTEFDTIMSGFKSSERFKGAVAIQNLLKQLIALIGAPVVAGKKVEEKEVKKVNGKASKRKNDDQEEEGEKVKVNKKTKKGKKEPEAEVEVEVEEDIEVEEEEPTVEVTKKEKKSKKDKKEKKVKT